MEYIVFVIVFVRRVYFIVNNKKKLYKIDFDWREKGEILVYFLDLKFCG